MPDPTLLYCVGATKAGTSGLYRYLHDHPECKLPAVKEAHYWDTFQAGDCAKQVAAYRRRLADMQAARDTAQGAGDRWKTRNLGRQMATMETLLQVLQGSRADDLDYAAWLLRDLGDARLVADVTPSYATLPEDMLRRMIGLTPASKVIYLMRDPIDRLWSHARMQAQRSLKEGEVYANKANGILRRIVDAGGAPHITLRGDYRTAVSKLRNVVPAGRLMIGFAETVFTPAGLRGMTDFLGIGYQPPLDRAVFTGEPARMAEGLHQKVAAFLQDQYDWVAAHVGPLPQLWQDNLKRAYA